MLFDHSIKNKNLFSLSLSPKLRLALKTSCVIFMLFHYQAYPLL